MTDNTVVCPRCTKRVRADDIHTCSPHCQEAEQEPGVVTDLRAAAEMYKGYAGRANELGARRKHADAALEGAARVEAHAAHLTALNVAIRGCGKHASGYKCGRVAARYPHRGTILLCGKCRVVRDAAIHALIGSRIKP